MRDRRASTDLAAVAGVRAADDRVLAAVERPERLEHRRRRLVRRALRHFRLREADPRVLLQEPVREIPPLRALADEGELGLRLHGHLRLDEGNDADDLAARQLGQRRALVAEDPRIAVLVGADLAGNAHGGERIGQRMLRSRIARVLVVMGDALDAGRAARVLHLQAWHEHRPLALGRDRERDRPLGGNEREPGVVEDVVRIEEHGAGERRGGEVLAEPLDARSCAPRAIWL